MAESKTLAAEIDGYIDQKTSAVTARLTGKDAIMLNAPAVYTPVELLTNAQDVAGAINELFRLEPGGGDDDDADFLIWQSLPEPAENQVIFVVRAYNISTGGVNSGDCIYIGGNADGSDIWNVDWGDGTSEIVHYTQTWHRYAETGTYIITCTALTDDKRDMMYSYGGRLLYYTKNILVMAKYGAQTVCSIDGNTSTYNEYYYLKYFKHCGSPQLRNDFFNNCYALKTAEFSTPLSIIYDNMFRHCHSLKKFDFSVAVIIPPSAFEYCCNLKAINAPQCTTVGQDSFYQNYGLRNVNMPLCTNVGAHSFSMCYSLNCAEFAENCQFENYAFQNCYGLHPRPDGSID